MCVCANSQGVNKDQLVCVVKQGYLRPFDQQEESELDKQHQDQLPDAADVQEHRAGQQGEQHTIAEILGQPGRKSTKVRGPCKQKKPHTSCTYTEDKYDGADLREMAGHRLAGTQSQAVLCRHGQVVQQAQSH